MTRLSAARLRKTHQSLIDRMLTPGKCNRFTPEIVVHWLNDDGSCLCGEIKSKAVEARGRKK